LSLPEVVASGSTNIEKSLLDTLAYIKRQPKMPALLLLVTDAEDTIKNPEQLKNEFVAARNNEEDFFVTTFIFLKAGNSGCHLTLQGIFDGLEEINVNTVTTEELGESVANVVKEITEIVGQRKVSYTIRDKVTVAESKLEENPEIINGVVQFTQVLNEATELFDNLCDRRRSHLD